MILAQVFKTGEGARKRAAFETAHSKTHTFRAVRFHDGQLDSQPFQAAEIGAYTWRVEKTKRT